MNPREFPSLQSSQVTGCREERGKCTIQQGFSFWRMRVWAQGGSYSRLPGRDASQAECQGQDGLQGVFPRLASGEPTLEAQTPSWFTSTEAGTVEPFMGGY